MLQDRDLLSVQEARDMIKKARIAPSGSVIPDKKV